MAQEAVLTWSWDKRLSDEISDQTWEKCGKTHEEGREEQIK